MAHLSWDKYRNIVCEYPEFKKSLRKCVREYHDPQKQFFLKALKLIPYFKNAPWTFMQEAMYSFKEHIIEKGQSLLREGSNATGILIVEKGCIEVYTEFEGNQFILDRLYPGSVINHRAFLMGDVMYVNMVCISHYA